MRQQRLSKEQQAMYARLNAIEAGKAKRLQELNRRIAANISILANIEKYPYLQVGTIIQEKGGCISKIIGYTHIGEVQYQILNRNTKGVVEFDIADEVKRYEEGYIKVIEL